MKSVIALLVAVAMLLPAALAVDTGFGFGINVTTEDFPPQIWMCDSRIVFDDAVEPGRITGQDQEMYERTQNYAFEGEQIEWTVLVMDKNGIDKIEDVYVSVGPVQGNGEFIEANCDRANEQPESIPESCNARILEEELTEFDVETMSLYTCRVTVETPQAMRGEYWVTANVVDLDGLLGVMDENEFWFFNPVVSLTIEGTPLRFNQGKPVRPGTQVYSNTITVGNGAEQNSGVMMDMFVTGTDFYDPAHSGAKCPTTNQLRLSNIRYFATHGAYSTAQDWEQDTFVGVQRDRDAEGYMNIEYGDRFSAILYENAEVIQAQKVGPYFVANVVSPGSEMSVTFKLSLPEPCNGDFTSGAIYFWGEAI